MQQIKPLFHRVDHISVICDREQDLYQLHNFFKNSMRFIPMHDPIRFPSCKCYNKARLTSNFFIGNLYICLVHFYNIGNLRRFFFSRQPRFSSLIFETDSLSEARLQLRQREIRFSDVKEFSLHKLKLPQEMQAFVESEEEEISLFKTYYMDPHLYNTSLFGARPFDYFLSMTDEESFLIGLKTYVKKSINVQNMRKHAIEKFKYQQSTSLKFKQVDRIVFSTNQSMVFTSFFDHLFSPFEPVSLTEWHLGDCPLIKLEENQTEGITHLDLQTESLLATKEHLHKENIRFIEYPDHLVLTDKRLKGLRFVIKE